MASIPIRHLDRTVGILYGARREWGRPDDAVINHLEAAGTVLAPLLSTAMSAREQTRLRVGEERQRIAGALHDDVGQLLFAISAAARRATALSCSGDAALTQAIEEIDALAGRAGDRLRDALSGLTPTAPLDRIPVSAQRDLDDFTERSGVPAHLLLPREPFPVPPAVERAALACLRQALFNVERHAAASLVIATVEFRPELLTVIVQDDGHGPPAGFEPLALPEDGHNWGCSAMLRHAEQLGGSVHIDVGDEGGAVVRIDLPITPVAAR